jgi:hypothetical protein
LLAPGLRISETRPAWIVIYSDAVGHEAEKILDRPALLRVCYRATRLLRTAGMKVAGPELRFRPEGRDQIGSAEVLPLEKERFSGHLRESIGKRVAEVQGGRMHAFAE